MNTGIRKIASCVAILAGFIAAEMALAHHSFAMFDRSQELVMKGKVARWAYNSPHVALYIENAAGELWAFEGAAPPHIAGLGITGYTFQPGEPVTVVMCPLHDGRHGGAVGFVIKEGDEDDFSAWFRPNDGGCGPSQSWGEWLPAGYTSRADAEEALGVEAGGGRGGFGPPN
jgi:hypothetical protein